MITSGLVVDGVGHGLQAHLPYNHQAVAAAVHNHRMSYAEPPAYLKSVVPPPPSPQLQQQQQSSEPPATPEFLRPLPKPAPVNPLKAPRASAKYAVAADCRPVNLTAAKEPLAPPPPPVEHHLRLDDRHHPYTVYGHPRLYVNASPYHHPYPLHQPPAPYGVYTSPYAPVIPRDARHHMMQPPPQERRYPSPPNKNGSGVGVGSQASPSSSPPEPFKVPNGRDSNKPPPQPQQQLQQQQHRILPPPPPPPPTSTFAALAVVNNNNNNNVVVAAAEPSPKKSRRNNTPEPQSPPAISAAKTSNFTKGSLIRLANGNIKKVEDMRTEDFLNSVEHSVLHRIDASTVVRIEPITDQTAAKGNMKITLSLGDQRNHQINGDNHNKKTSAAATACKSQHVEVESGAEHPYFVFGRGWASCSPTKTLAKYGLTCQRLQVGDVCVSLTRRPAAAADSTTTTTAPQGGGKRRHHHQHQQPPTSVAVHQQQPHNNHNQQQQQLHQHHYHNNNNNNSNNHHHPTAVQKTQIQLHHLQQQQLQPLCADDDKNGRNKRRWSAPDPEPAT